MSQELPRDRSKFEEREETSDVEFSFDSDGQPAEKNFKKKPSLPVPEEKKAGGCIERTIWTFSLLFGFGLLISMGHFYVACLVYFINFRVFKEITDIRRKQHRERDIVFSVFLNYYFFWLAICYMTVKTFESRILDDPNFPFLELVRGILARRDFIAFVLWTIGFVGFVTVLRQGYYKYQVTSFAMTHVTILTVNLQLMLCVDNLYYGLVWLVLPAMMVITNDVFAYVFGKMFGKTKLIDLSKNKTWEGFIGGMIGSFMFSLLLTELFSTNFMRFMICPQDKLTMIPFNFVNQCELPHIYLYRDMYIPGLSYFFGTFYINEFKVHIGVLALFASIIAPFGGFFASGVKRAYKIKDFADTIPGHGGLTDRFDCQTLMGTFTYFYLREIVHGYSNSMSSVITYFGMLSDNDQLKLYKILASKLSGKGMIDE